jgi:hypothetical protein
MTRNGVIDRGGTGHGPPAKHGSGGSGPERVTVNLIPRAAQALHEVSDLTGDSKTDSINRALQVYNYLMTITESGGEILVREPGDSDPRVLKMF